MLPTEHKFSFRLWINNPNYSEIRMFVSTMSLAARWEAKQRNLREFILTSFECVFWTAIAIFTQTSKAFGCQMMVRVYQNHDCIKYLHTHTNHLSAVTQPFSLSAVGPWERCKVHLKLILTIRMNRLIKFYRPRHHQLVFIFNFAIIITICSNGHCSNSPSGV